MQGDEHFAINMKMTMLILAKESVNSSVFVDGVGHGTTLKLILLVLHRRCCLGIGRSLWIGRSLVGIGRGCAAGQTISDSKWGRRCALDWKTGLELRTLGADGDAHATAVISCP